MNDPVIYRDMIQPKGAPYRPSQIVPHSHYNDPIDRTPGRLAGHSRIWGDASPEVQSRTIDLLLDAAHDAGLGRRDMALVLAIARRESGFNPDAAAGTTSALGLGQFVDRTGAAYGLRSAKRGDPAEQARALVAHYIDNRRLAASRGQGEDYIYKYHHDGPSLDYGGLAVSRSDVLPHADRYGAFVDHWLQARGVDAPATTRDPAPASRATPDPLADGIIRHGERGEAVRQLQARLNAHGMQGLDGKPLPLTGNYLDHTQAAVREFQRRHDLPVTGQADATTRSALARPPEPATTMPATRGIGDGRVDLDEIMRRMLPPQGGKAPHVTSPFGAERGAVDHGGVDFNYVGGQSGVNLRHPTVHAPVSGTVVFAGGQYGAVKIRDAAGNMHEILHLQTQAVREGQPIEAGAPIGTMGGRGPRGESQYAQHVHYQLRDSTGRVLDPAAFWSGARGQALDSTGAPASPRGALADGELRFGERGGPVRDLQARLNAFGIRDEQGRALPLTGNYRERTQAAVAEFQRTHGLPETGVADRATLAALARPTSSAAKRARPSPTCSRCSTVPASRCR